MRGVAGRVSSPRFVGRLEELEVVVASVARSAEGRGTVMLVGGEPGMGKSRLVAELGRLAAATGVTAATGECLPLGDGDLPYAPIVTALRSLLRDRGGPELDIAHDEVARLLPELDGGPDRPALDGSGSAGRLFEQLLAVFAALARAGPILLVVEDIHWSDASTRDFLTYLVRGTRRERLALVLTYRSDEVDRHHAARPFLTELERSGQARRLELRGFGRAEVIEQVGAILDSEPEPALVDDLLRRAEGNPFFTEELLATVEEPHAPLPESLRDAMLGRVDGASEQVRAVLQVTAVAMRGVDHGLLGRRCAMR